MSKGKGKKANRPKAYFKADEDTTRCMKNILITCLVRNTTKKAQKAEFLKQLRNAGLKEAREHFSNQNVYSKFANSVRKDYKDEISRRRAAEFRVRTDPEGFAAQERTTLGKA